MKKFALYTLCVAVLSSCDIDWTGFVAPPSDTANQRFEQSLAWNETHGYTQLSVPTDDYKFYVGTDIHTEATADNLTAMITAMRNDNKAHFALLLGDLVHGKGNYPTFIKALEFNAATQAQNDTVFATLGNHDLYFDQWKEYEKYWHTATYYFVVNTPNFSDLFISLDTGSGTLGDKQLAWLKNILQTQGKNRRHIVVYTHTNLFKTDNTGFPTSNMAIEETFEITSILQQYSVDLHLSGHNHFRHDTRYRDVRYITIDALKDENPNPFYMTASVSDEISCEFISPKAQ